MSLEQNPAAKATVSLQAARTAVALHTGLVVDVGSPVPFLKLLPVGHLHSVVVERAAVHAPSVADFLAKVVPIAVPRPVAVSLQLASIKAVHAASELVFHEFCPNATFHEPEVALQFAVLS